MSLFGHRHVRIGFALVMTSALAGCWMSADPLIGPDNASSVPFAEAYKPAKEDVVVEVEANADGSYTLTDGKNGFTAFFLNTDEGWFVSQQDFKEVARDNASEDQTFGPFKAEVAEGNGPYIYQLVHMSGGDILFYEPVCDEKTATIEGVTRKADEAGKIATCIFEDAATLKLAAQMLKERIEAGELDIEPNMLTAYSGQLAREYQCRELAPCQAGRCNCAQPALP